MFENLSICLHSTTYTSAYLIYLYTKCCHPNFVYINMTFPFYHSRIQDGIFVSGETYDLFMILCRSSPDTISKQLGMYSRYFWCNFCSYRRSQYNLWQESKFLSIFYVICLLHRFHTPGIAYFSSECCQERIALCGTTASSAFLLLYCTNALKYLRYHHYCYRLRQNLHL